MIVAAPLANLVIRRLGRNADRQEVGGRLNLRRLADQGWFELRLKAFRPVRVYEITLSREAQSLSMSRGASRI
jgi:hypothetical protein